MRIQVTPETTSQAAAATARTRASAQAVWSRTKRSIDLSHESDVTAPSPADKLGRPGVGDDAADASACKAARKGITPAAGLEAADAVDGGASAGT